MAYDTPGAMNSTVDIFTWVNTVTESSFFPLIIIGVYIIIFVKMLLNPQNTAAKSFAASSFMMMIVTVFARVLDFVGTPFMSIFIILTAIGGIWMHLENIGGSV